MDKPLQHQLDAAEILGPRSILADKRGLGKTLSSLLWAKKSRRLLCIARKEVAQNFLEEIELWCPERKPLSLISKSVHERRVILQICRVLDEVTLVVNLEAWWRDRQLVQELADLRFDTVIVDEAHSLKDEGSLAFRGVRDIVYTKNLCSACGHINLMSIDVGTFCTNCFELNSAVSPIRNVQLLTGTPILNTPYDFWPLLHLLDEERWPAQDKFLRNHCYQGPDSRWRFLPGSINLILAWLGANYLARTREDAGVILPPQKILPYHIEFDRAKYSAQWDIYAQIKDAAAIKISKTDTHDIISMLALITRLRQCIVWPAGINVPIKDDDGETIGHWQCEVHQSCKLDAAEKLTQELLEEGHKVVLYSQFVPPLLELHKRIGQDSVVLYRHTPDHVRRAIRHDFDRRYSGGKWRVLLANSKVGGESLNFNAATAGIIIDREWSPGREDQETGRLDRMGQTEESVMYILQAEPSIDQWQDTLIKHKQAMLDDFTIIHQELKEYLFS